MIQIRLHSRTGRELAVLEFRDLNMFVSCVTSTSKKICGGSALKVNAKRNISNHLEVVSATSIVVYYAIEF